jgi:hypothetical protein
MAGFFDAIPVRPRISPESSSYSHKNMRKFKYYSLISDPAEELPALFEISNFCNALCNAHFFLDNLFFRNNDV